MGGPDFPYVQALAVSGADLYVGGDFTTAGATAANYVAKWNGTDWSALGLGIGGSFPYVYSLAVSGPDLYAGGWFSMAGGSSANNIAEWNGSTWSALGSGLNAQVYALAVSGTNLYAGGAFGMLSISADVAKWDGSAWSTLGSMGGLYTPYVYALAVQGSDLYVGGFFSQASGVPANYIAKWDGSAWSALGSGIGGVDNMSMNMYEGVTALAVSGTDLSLYAGGSFTMAGNQAAGHVAKARLGVLSGRFSNLLYLPATGFLFTFSDASVGQAYRIQSRSSLATGNWADLSNCTYTGPITITDTSAAGAANKFYRAVSP